jgi:DNA-directed RNA polymerase alpha subunit
MQDWPLLIILAVTAVERAVSRSALGITMNGSLPPSSTTDFLRFRPAAPATETPVAAEPAPEAAAMPISDLGLSARVAKALEAEGITTAGQLAAKLAQGDEELLAISGIGAKAVEEIAAKLSEHGLSASA